MGRSVNYQSGAEIVKYFHVEPVYGFYNPETDEYEGEEFNPEETQWAFESDVENVKYALMKAIPSFNEVPDYNQSDYMERAIHHNADRECWPLLYNGNAVVVLSEYCGLVSVSVVPLENMRGDYYGPSKESLERHWINQVEPRVNTALDSVVERLICCGRFSNGEAVYQKASSRRAQLSAGVNGESL